MKPYFERKEELSSHDGCILWGARVVVPRPYRASVLVQLHEGHPGATRMKGLSRMYVWWPGITKDVEDAVKDCHQCQQHQATPCPSPLHPWAWPTRPWARLHVDYAGPVEGHMVVIVVDAHSKWIEAIPTSGSTSKVVIEELRFLFSQFGIPESLVSDNCTCFSSGDFEMFLKKNGVKHLLSAPYHPATNGLAERAVQDVKSGLRKTKNGSLRSRIVTILFAYRLTPQTTTKQSPSELLLGRRPRSRLDLLKPHTAERVELQQSKQVEVRDRHSKEREFKIDNPVYVRNYGPGYQWSPGVVQERFGALSFRVKLPDGRIRRCHIEQMRKRTDRGPFPESLRDVVNEDITTGQVVPTATTEYRIVESGSGESTSPTDLQQVETTSRSTPVRV